LPPSFKSIKIPAVYFRELILKSLGIPNNLQPEYNIDESLISANKVVIIIIDNFGLFETVVYKPETLIKNLELIALLETNNPYAIPLLSEIIYGAQQQTNDNLLRRVYIDGKNTTFIGRKEDIATFVPPEVKSIECRDDMTAYVQATKVINRQDLVFIHFLDFEFLYAQYARQTPPEKLIQKLITRTDNWVKILYRQAESNTLFIIIGNHGRHELPMQYEGKLAEWRKANAPVAILFKKK